MRNRVKTGIRGVDVMLGGGIPENSQVILAGGPGSGKTLFSFEFLYNGAKNGETCMYFSFNEDSSLFLQNVKDSLSSLTDIDELISSKKLMIYGYEETKNFIQKGAESTSYAFTSMISQIESRISDYHATRIVIDSMSYLQFYAKDAFEYRNLSTSLLAILHRQNVTSIMTTELYRDMSRMQPEFFIYDGLMLLEDEPADDGAGKPTFQVLKMRGTSHARGKTAYQITSSGTKVISQEES